MIDWYLPTIQMLTGCVQLKQTQASQVGLVMVAEQQPFSASAQHTTPGRPLFVAAKLIAFSYEISTPAHKSAGGYRAFTGNEIAALLANWVWTNHKRACPQVGTLATMDALLA